jgi:TATA-box binding protein (TBP) (component of TFIID and TFIIIB)
MVLKRSNCIKNEQIFDPIAVIKKIDDEQRNRLTKILYEHYKKKLPPIFKHKSILNKVTLKEYFPGLTKTSIKELIKLVELDKLPEGIRISTMTITCKIGTKINLENIARFIDLTEDRILSVKYGQHPLNNRSIMKIKKKTTSKKKKKNFYNEATIKIKPIDNNPINIKLFKNESLQLTGVKSMDNFCEVLSKLFFELKKEKYVIDHDKLKLKPFVEDVKKLKLHVNDVKICMINTNFKIKNEIDRDLLYEKLQHDGVACTYEPCLHACVNVKYQYSAQKKVSIFVFKSGAIIITGANTTDHVIKAFNFIFDKLQVYGSDIMLASTEELFKCKELKKYL